MIEAIAGRTTNKLPLSIGTCFAIESLFPSDAPDKVPRDNIPPRVDMKNYDTVFINVATLLRNILNASKINPLMDRNKIDSKVVGLLAITVDTEIRVIQAIAKENGWDSLVFYAIQYKNLDDKFKLRNQGSLEAFNKLYARVLSGINYVHIISLVNSINPNGLYKKGIILTHQPFDLLSYKYFNKLDLIESHTGLLKSKKEWGSKYCKMNKADLSLLPFNETLLGIFGDNHLIAPVDMIRRREVVEIAVRKKWLPITTETKVKGDIHG